MSELVRLLSRKRGRYRLAVVFTDAYLFMGKLRKWELKRKQERN